uniref:Secreted protein n=1 Tax=Cucumis melo TaxID=3656 RepID=A0A9I9EKQ9_CUCME
MVSLSLFIFLLESTKTEETWVRKNQKNNGIADEDKQIHSWSSSDKTLQKKDKNAKTDKPNT